MAAHAEQRRALDFVELVGRAHRLEQPRQHADSDAEALEDPDCVEQAMVAVAAPGGDQGTVDVVLGEQVLECVEVAQQRQFIDARVVETERNASHHLHSGPVAAIQLGGKPVGSIRITEDQTALLLHQLAGQGSGQAAQQKHREEQESPKDGRLRAPEGPVDDVGAGEECQQRVEGCHLEDRGRLVEGPLVEKVLVPVIQPCQLADRDHHCNRKDRPKPERVVAEDRDGDHERGCRCDYVGRAQQPAIDGVAGGGGRRRIALGAAVTRPPRRRTHSRKPPWGGSGGGPCRLDRAGWLNAASRILPKFGRLCL